MYFNIVLFIILLYIIDQIQCYHINNQLIYKNIIKNNNNLYVFNNRDENELNPNKIDLFGLYKAEYPGKFAFIIAGLTDTDYLDRIDDLFVQYLRFIPPVILLDENDNNKSLNNILLDVDNYDDRDHIIPLNPIKVSHPIAIFSGFRKKDVLQIVSSYKSIVRESKQLPSLAFAITVPNAMSKPLSQLCNEIYGDFENNTGRTFPIM